MKLSQGLLLASAALAGLVPAPGARAAGLPARQAAPIEYVRICDAYGAGFFYIPGTDTCLRVGGLALTELRGFDPSFTIAGPLFHGNGAQHLGAGFVPLPFEYYGSNGSAALGGLGQQLDTFNTTAGTGASRAATVLNKAFIQFAGLTAGRAQSMFDFSADAYNYPGLRGSNATVVLFAYTATFGNGFSGTISFEDQPDRRAAIASTPAAPITIGGVSATSFQGLPAGSRAPEIVGNLRLDQPWGAVQLSAAAHQLSDSLFAMTALTAPPGAYAFPALTSNSFGFAVQGGVHLNAGYLSPGDKLWLQAAYEKGAFGYVAGNNPAYSYGPVNQNRFPGSGDTPLDYGDGRNPRINSGCVFTGSGPCEQQWGWDITGAYKHYWLPILSSAVYGSYLEVHYPANALNGFGGAAGDSNLKQARIGSNLVWPPLKGFDIGAEFMYVHLNQTRPTGLAPDPALTTNGLPAFQPNTKIYEGRLRVQRAF
ncbi:MAG: porin [Methylocella sp.]